MTLIQLKYFQTICKYNNITRASAELHVSQPSLSNAVKELEREFGVSLFTRRSRGLELTPEGRYFLDEADKLLEQAEQLTTNMKHMSTTDRTLTLGLPAMSGSLVFTDLLRTLYARSPGTHIQVMENGSLANRSKIMDHTLDAAIITRNGPLPPGIGHVTLRHVNICLYLSVMHPLAEKDTVTTDDLDQLPLAMLPEDTFLYSGVRSSVMIFSKPFMSSGWEGHTQRVLYYSLEKQEDKEKQKQEYERLEEIWSQRDSYYGKWEHCRREKTVENRNGIKVPANWQYNSFWFAGAAGIEAAKWNLLPENYRPEEQINLEIEDPALLLQEMLREQEEITKELKELLKEVG